MTDKSKAPETELVIYAKITDYQGLQEADHIEYQVQLDGTFSNGERCRCREVKVDEDVKYYFTFKINKEVDNHDQCDEYTTEIDEEFFEGFKEVANTISKKTRYVFNSRQLTFIRNDTKDELPIDNIKYEVDVYEGLNGEAINWCKIDIEIDELLNTLSNNYDDVDSLKFSIKISHLPFKPTQYTTKELNKTFVDDLWGNHFTSSL